MIFNKVDFGDILCQQNGVETYINSSYIIGKNEIVLGIYCDVEYMVASLFHELGHATTKCDWSVGANEYTQYECESDAWELGFGLAEEYGYVFSENTIVWCYKQLESYKK